jgi:hypothetical protein
LGRRKDIKGLKVGLFGLVDMSLHEMSLQNIKKKSIFNIFLKNHTKISCLVPILISLRKPKKIQKSVSFLLSTGTISRKRAQKKPAKM